MTKEIRKVIYYLLAEDENLSLENRLFLTSVLISIAITVVAIVLGVILTLPIYLIITGFLIFSVSALLYLIARTTGRYKPLIIIFVNVCCAANVAIFIFGGGIDGQNVTILCITLILSLIIIPKKIRIHVLISYIVIVIGLYLLQYFRPDYITDFHSEEKRWVDGLTTTLYSIIFITLIIQFLLRNYTNEKLKAEKSELNLQNLNRNLEKIIEQRTGELKESKDKFQTLLNSAAEGIFGMDLDGCFSYINKSCLRILGYKKEDELIGKKVHDKIHHSHPGGMHIDVKDCRICITLAQGTGNHADDEFLIRSDGTMVPVEFWSYPVIINGKLQGAVVTFVDVTERKKAEKELLTAKLEAEIANSAKSDFLLNISHEFRTPLNAVIGYADLLESAQGEIRKEYSDSIKSGGRRLLDMVNNILELIRAEKAEIELDYDYIETEMFFNEFKKNFSSYISEKGLEFRTELADNLPSALYIDGKHLRLIINNLVDNALKFTSEGTIELIVYHRMDSTSDKGKTDLIIEVKDTGKGITEEYQKRLFEAFSQAEKKTGTSGLGIGLSLVHRIVNRMNGKIVALSQPGMGSRFIITLHDVAFSEKGGIVRHGNEKAADMPAESNFLRKDDIFDLKGLISELEGSYFATFRKFEVRQPINEVRKFGQDLFALGLKHNCVMITDYGRKLEEATGNFEIDNILDLIRKYPDNIEILKKN